jgi:hypothetical protein
VKPLAPKKQLPAHGEPQPFPEGPNPPIMISLPFFMLSSSIMGPVPPMFFLLTSRPESIFYSLHFDRLDDPILEPAQTLHLNLHQIPDLKK